QRFVGGAVAPGRIGAGLGERAPRGADLFGALFINVGVTGLYESLGKLIHVLKVVAGEVQVFFFAVMPVETQPLHHVDDGFDVFGFFLFGIGVVETQVTGALIVACEPEVQADALGVADVQVAIGLRRKAGAHARRVGRSVTLDVGRARASGPGLLRMATFRQIFFDDGAQEVGNRTGTGGRTHTERSQ